MSRPDAVVIDDLAAPRYPAEVAPIRAVMDELGATLTLDPDALMQAAVDETGLDDFGPNDFVPRLELICQCLTKEAGFGPAGVLGAHTQLVALLRNRLRVEDVVRRHPELTEAEVRAPIIICGLPRTGTTHLHNLLSADPALRSLPYWESEEPVNRPEAGDGRIERTAVALDVLNAALPYFRRMHDMTPEHVHEEIGLIALDFSGMQFETMAPMPTWRDYYLASDQRPHYAYLKKVLQVLQFVRREGERWVLKSPQHLEQFPALADTFPDATFVVTHRDPVSVTLSLGTMMSYLSRLSRDPVDPLYVSRYWAERLEAMLRTCVETRDVLPAERAIDVRFSEFMADDVGMVRRVYEVAGQPFTADVRAAMDAFMADNQRGRHGGVEYRWGDLGLDPAERRSALEFYVDRFGVEVE